MKTKKKIVKKTVRDVGDMVERSKTNVIVVSKNRGKNIWRDFLKENYQTLNSGTTYLKETANPKEKKAYFKITKDQN